MKILTVGKFKADFSEVLREIAVGEEYVISYGKSKKKVAVVIPFDKYKKGKGVKLGLLQGKAGFSITTGFKMSDEELLNL